MMTEALNNLFSCSQWYPTYKLIITFLGLVSSVMKQEQRLMLLKMCCITATTVKLRSVNYEQEVPWAVAGLGLTWAMCCSLLC